MTYYFNRLYNKGKQLLSMIINYYYCYDSSWIRKQQQRCERIQKISFQQILCYRSTGNSILLLMFLLLQTSFPLVRSSASSTKITDFNTNNIQSPIRSFIPSIIASSIHGTTIAIAFTGTSTKQIKILSHNDINIDQFSGVVILFCSPKSESNKKISSNNNENQSTFHSKKLNSKIFQCGVRLESNNNNNEEINNNEEDYRYYDDDDDDDTSYNLDGTILDKNINNNYSDDYNDQQQRWILLGSNNVNTAFVTMTGLVSDVDYLSRVIQKQYETFRYIYNDDNYVDNSESSSSTTNHIIQTLSDIVREATMYTSSRPYGIQALVIGSSSASSTAGSATTGNRVYTIDPSGIYRHWKYGTVIGRDALQLRYKLYRMLSSKSSSLSSSSLPSNGIDALRMALRLLVPTTTTAKIKAKTTTPITTTTFDQLQQQQQSPPNNINAILLWNDNNNNGMKLATIDPDFVNEIYQDILSSS